MPEVRRPTSSLVAAAHATRMAHDMSHYGFLHVLSLQSSMACAQVTEQHEIAWATAEEGALCLLVSRPTMLSDIRSHRRLRSFCGMIADGRSIVKIGNHPCRSRSVELLSLSSLSRSAPALLERPAHGMCPR